MGLKDLIAQSGAKNFETMRKGWLPTLEEKQTRRMRDLKVQEAEQTLAYEPERRSYLRQKQKADLTTQEQATQLFDEKMKKYKTDEEILSQDRKLTFSSRIVRGAYSVMGKDGIDIEQSRKIFRDNLDGLLDANDKEGDAIINKFVSPETSNEEAVQLLKNFNSLMPLAQEALDKQRLAVSKGKNTLYEILKERQSLGTLDDTDQRKLDKLSGKTSSEKFDKTMSYKSTKDKKKQMISSRAIALKSMESTTKKNDSITQAMQALESGDNTLSDKLLTAALSNLTDSSVRAFKMYEVFDSSLGNIVERMQDWIDRGVQGTRNEEQKAKILSVLQKMQKYNEPVMKKLRKHHRAIARADGHDPYKVVPPKTKEEVAEDETLNIEQKLKLLKDYGLMKK